ncbi:MAG TPA: class I SAM-dependent methyltransferase [Methanomassiliicoccales archaeon]|nr:class I SAM-dependent methyltransferase [Methanomassiliicoccales archaeon]
MHRVRLTGETATLLITLYAKALDHRSRRPILNDEKADEVVRMIDYDFEKLNKFGRSNLIVVRAKHFDEWIKEFMKSNPRGVVLNLGCGLDPRVFRMDLPPGIDWFDVDYPEVIEERRYFFSERGGYHMIASSLTSAEWLEAIPKDRPAMIVADGVLEYLTPENVKVLLNRLTGYFPSGQIAFDVMNSFGVNSARESLKETTGAVHNWAVDNIHAVDEMDPKLRRLDNLSVFRSRYIKRLPLGQRVTYGMMCVIPTFRKMIRLLRYEF